MLNDIDANKNVIEFYRLAQKYGFDIPFCLCEEKCGEECICN
jgi:hypothetical protein